LGDKPNPNHGKNEEIKVSLLADEMIINIEKTKECTKN
jgi:hypothetical protein